MRRHRPLPTIWLMTDERIADLLAVVGALPRGSGVVFRHYALPQRERQVLFAQVRAIAARRRLMLVVAGNVRGLRGDGYYGRSRKAGPGIRTVPIHSPRELRQARLMRADLVFVSPVFATRSHPNAKPLGVVRLGLMLGTSRRRAIALGGMNTARWWRVRSLGLHGWAAIDGLSG